MLIQPICPAGDTSGIQKWQFKEYEVRTLIIDGTPWFVGADVATALGYADCSHAILDHVDSDDRVNSKTQGHIVREFGQRGAWLINESGVYALVFGSKLESAKEFKHWVTSEVLPQIRKTGKYEASPQPSRQLQLDSYMIPDPIKRAERWIEEQKEHMAQIAMKDLQIEQKDAVIEAQDAQIDAQKSRIDVQTATITAQQVRIESDKPKVEFADAVMASKDPISVDGLSKLLQKNGIKIGRNKLFEYLRARRYLISRGRDKNVPTQYSMNLDLFEVSESTWYDTYGEAHIELTTLVTAKGQEYFIKQFKKLEECGISWRSYLR